MVLSINRGEKLSTVKLTVVQYGILLMMLAWPRACGACRC